MGEAPPTDFTRWRLRLAATRLRKDDCNVGAVAEQVGYESAAAFNHAYKHKVGVSPGRYCCETQPELASLALTDRTQVAPK